MHRRNPQLANLLEWRPDTGVVGYDAGVAGHGEINNQIARTIARALQDAKDAGFPRAEISRRMADYLGRPLAKGSLDKWASEATEERCIPLDAFAALVHAIHEATGRFDLLGLLPSLFDYAAVPIEQVELIEIQLIEEHEQEVLARKATLQAKARARRTRR